MKKRLQTPALIDVSRRRLSVRNFKYYDNAQTCKTTNVPTVDWTLLFKNFHKTAKSDYWHRHVCLSIRLSAWTNDLLLGGFP